MSIAAATLRMHPARGPALRRAKLPVTATLLSAVLHGCLAAGVVLAAGYWATEQPKAYVVNLVPAVAAVGSPEGRAEAPPTPTPPPPLPSRAPELPRPAPPRPADLPPREASRDMPPRPRETAALPDRTLPARAPALPKAGDKELPRMESTAKAAPTPTPVEKPAPDVARAAAPPPPVPIGRRDGSPAGAGAMTLNATDFPYAWYLSRVQAKVTERWSGKALPGQQPVAVFEINRDGQVGRLSIEKSSGNSYYDQAALRAIAEANPFPPLPAEYTEPTLRVHLGFNFSAERG
ncbi:MAG TPA: TonB family protein [Methylomirabilota bacterium]|nr:TonB family protein [Methylomirabilota bacterium]